MGQNEDSNSIDLIQWSSRGLEENQIRSESELHLDLNFLLLLIFVWYVFLVPLGNPIPACGKPLGGYKDKTSANIGLDE